MRLLARSAVLALLVLLLVPAIALAAKPTGFFAAGGIAVTDLDPANIVLAGNSGRVRITSEASSAVIGFSDAPELLGATLLMEQKSNELFSGNPLADPFGVVALSGNSHGTFDMISPLGQPIGTGQYSLKVSNSEDCQIAGAGHWSTTGGSDLKGRGTVTSCLNATVISLEPLIVTFTGTFTFEGTLN